MNHKRYFLKEGGAKIDMPSVFIIGMPKTGQELVLSMYQTLGVGGGPQSYVDVGDYKELLPSLTFVAGNQVNKDWRELAEKYSDALFIAARPELTEWLQNFQYSKRGIQAQKFYDYYSELIEYFGVDSRRILFIQPKCTQAMNILGAFIGIITTRPNPHAQSDFVRYIEKAGVYMNDGGRYLKAMRKWQKAGKPLRSLEAINGIFDNQCSKCFAFDYDMCSICRCRIKRDTQTMNKLAWGTEECPLPEPKWKADVQIELTREELPPPPPKPKPEEPKKGCC